MHRAFLAAYPDGFEHTGRHRLTRVGGNRQRDHGAEALFESQRRVRRRAPRHQFELRGIAGLPRERNVLRTAQQIVHIRQVALQRKRDPAADGDPDGTPGGDRFGGREDAGGRVRGDGGRDQVRSAGQSEIWPDLGCAGDNAVGNGEECDAGVGDQDVVGLTERLEKRLRGRRKFRLKR